MYSYRSYGETIRSDIDLLFLNKDSEIKDDYGISISLDNEINDLKDASINYKKSFFSKKNAGSYEVHDGNHIGYKLFKNCNRHLFEKTLLYTALPIALFQKGNIVLHASCLRIGDKTVVFSGNKGSGKSSIANALLDKANLIAEDRTVLSFRNNSFYTSPSNINLFKLDPSLDKSKFFFKSRLDIEGDFLKRDCFEVNSNAHFNIESKIDSIIFLNNNGHSKDSYNLDFSEIFKNIFAFSIKPNLKDQTKANQKKLLGLFSSICNSSIKFSELYINKKDKINKTVDRIIKAI